MGRSNGLSLFFSLLISSIIFGIIWFFALPALSFANHGFWLILILFTGVTALIYGFFTDFDGEILQTILLVLLGLIAASWIILSISSGKLFNSSRYREVITVATDGNYELDLPEVDSAGDIPIVDVVTAQKLGDRQMGVMEKYLSQYEVNNEYDLITYKGEYFRISPMEYGGFMKWCNCNTTGIPGYVLVNVFSQEAKLVELESGHFIKYSPSAFFGQNMKRHLRGLYPFSIFGEEHFEIDDDGAPYYIVPIMKPNASLFGAKTISQVILLNAITGATAVYSLGDVPDWVDNVYSVHHLMKVISWNYDLIHGAINFSKKDVRKTSYSYDNSQYYLFPKGDDVFLYVGITSAGNDESNIGFLLANMRTGESTYYSNPGAEESSAQASAQGVVQQYGYTAGPVMLVNIAGEETYFMTLKDAQLLVKKYALVNKNDYNLVVVEDTIEQTVENYKNQFLPAKPVNTESKMINGTIQELYEFTQSGTTMYLFQLTSGPNIYVSSIDINIQQAKYMQIGTFVQFMYAEAEGGVYPVTSIEFADAK